MKISALLPMALLVTAAAFSVTGHAQEKPTTAQVTTTASDMTDGEIRKIDKDAMKITIRHGEIKHLEMPSMTMVFQVKDAAFLEQVKVGDKVKFSVAQTGGALVVTQIQPAQ